MIELIIIGLAAQLGLIAGIALGIIAKEEIAYGKVYLIILASAALGYAVSIWAFIALGMIQSLSVGIISALLVFFALKKIDTGNAGFKSKKTENPGIGKCGICITLVAYAIMGAVYGGAAFSGMDVMIAAIAFIFGLAMGSIVLLNLMARNGISEDDVNARLIFFQGWRMPAGYFLLTSAFTLTAITVVLLF